MSNEATKAQIRSWLDEAVRKARNPDPREKIIQERKKRIVKISQYYGL
jgi:hypothetical protein